MKSEKSFPPKDLEEKSSKSRLEELIVKEKDVSEEILHDILKDYIRFTEKGEFIFQSQDRDLSTKDKILLILLAAKAQKILKIRNEEMLYPKEIARILGIRNDIVRALLSNLKKEGLAHSPERGLWTVNWSKLGEIKGRFKR
jgi:DNA-binding CsgD family transcriptional regulator